MIEIDQLQTKVNKIEGFYQALKTRESDLKKEIKLIKNNIDTHTKTSKVLKHLLDTLVKDEISRMAGLITYGLKTVFEDQNLTFMPVLSKKNEKINISLKTENEGIEGEFGSFGGSVAVIESFLLRILFIIKMKLAHLMIMDETFSSVGSEYIPNTSKLIGEISKKIGMDILLVTHQKEFREYADHVYEVKESEKGLKIEKLK